ncbi:transcription elongation factor-like protein spt6 [Lepidopterella palustris CBS 459.81]|uniref:Transcription elongation factor Spt6 n=1 Tax=Lepidopterella palustris CBS 459.81 TaxID=1314670 RepID=A0A8E2EFP8_9PEZI|nr:transcription elongation factor-like protein spt6 [Lepidopterella palustris CBS 459.81]
MSTLVDDIAELGSEEEDEGFDEDEETGEPRKKINGAIDDMDDSSEEGDDDDDEEAAAAIREGFIVDEDEDEEERAQRKERRKRRRKDDEVEVLDEEDLDLIGEANPDYEPRQSSQSKFKRLKRGHREERTTREARGVDEIFSDDDEVGEEVEDRRREHRGGLVDEFADFIEEDEFDDDIQRELEDDREVARPGLAAFSGVDGLQAAGLDEAAQEDFQAAFGDGTEYDWALNLQLDQDEKEHGESRELELKDVFEPSQLVDKMLTDEDNKIRATDIPERMQLARKPFKEIELTEVEMEARLQDEAQWVTSLVWPKKRLASYYTEPFRKAVYTVLKLLNLENYEVPFIFTHRKDYLIHAGGDSDLDPDDPDAPPPDAPPERLLAQNDLWEIFELDLKYRALAEKRDALQRAYDNLRGISNVTDPVFEEMVPKAVTIEELQEIQDYLHFQYSAEIKDINLMESETNGTQKRAQSSRNLYEKVRASKVYSMVRAFGITADSFAQNVLATGRRQYTEDPTERPDDMADSLIEAPEYLTGQQVLRTAKAMYVEELVMSPRMRRYMRQCFYQNGMVDCIRTEKGLRKIGEDHPYYEFKYLRGQDFISLSRQPDMYLKMLKAEEEGLIEVKVRMDGYDKFKQKLYQYIESDNFSEVADAWNILRREALDIALGKLEKIMARGVKETLRTECENELCKTARDKYYEKLDQAPYKPKGTDPGTVPRVLALSNGKGDRGDAICWVYVEPDGRVVETGKFTELRLGNPDKYVPDGKDVANLAEICRRRKPDVIGVSGFAVETKRLFRDLQDIIDKHDLRGPEYEDPDDDGIEKSDKLEVIMVNDEVARLYFNSPRASEEFPNLPPTTRYCVALARYLQSPMQEYAALGKDIVSIPFVPNQSLLPQEKLLDRLDSAMVDMVNLVGIEINEAVSDPYLATLLPFICGLGPRKAEQMLKTISINGGEIYSRAELVGYSTDREIRAAVGPKVFQNCASFLYIRFDPQESESDYLDNTRVHPEDYDLGRKMAADAMEMDEEDVKGETDEYGPSGVIRKMIREDANDRVQDLLLEAYAEQIERNIHTRKRATLETIRAELLVAYEEIRRPYSLMSTDEVFTMLTGETRESLTEGMVVPVQIKRCFPDHIDVKLDCGIEGGISESEYPEGVGGTGIEPRHAYQIHQTVRAKILYINRKGLSAQLTLRDDLIRQAYRKEVDRMPGEWDERQEAEDKKAAEKEKEITTGRAHRVVNHPLFFAFNAAQAEEYLGSKEPGEVVIRPSSKGLDHLAVTWKVSDNIYQHLDVLELDKENEYSLGKILKVGRNTYSDLDELIVNHVEAMAKKVTEMMKDERYQKGSKAQTEQWLKTYTEANPKRSMYAFCINPKFPGFFYLCYKAGQTAPLGNWPVKIVPNAFELQRHQYPDMNALKNGFKLLFQNAMANGRGGPPRR